MDLLKQTLDLCKIYNIKPKKSKGQNFLIEEAIYNKIIEVAEIKPDDIILEVGPGLGFLTFKLAKLAKKVLTVEVDDKITDFLQTLVLKDDIKNIKIFNKNILKLKGKIFLKLVNIK